MKNAPQKKRLRRHPSLQRQVWRRRFRPPPSRRGCRPPHRGHLRRSPPRCSSAAQPVRQGRARERRKVHVRTTRARRPLFVPRTSARPLTHRWLRVRQDLPAHVRRERVRPAPECVLPPVPDSVRLVAVSTVRQCRRCPPPFLAEPPSDGRKRLTKSAKRVARKRNQPARE